MLNIFLKRLSFKPIKKKKIIIYTYKGNEELFDFISKSFQEKVGFIYCNHFNFFLFIKSILIKYLLKK